MRAISIDGTIYLVKKQLENQLFYVDRFEDDLELTQGVTVDELAKKLKGKYPDKPIRLGL